jgi:hypothetical protein
MAFLLQVLEATLPLVIGGAGEGSSPAAGRLRGEGTFAVGALVIARTEPAAGSKVLPGEAAEMPANRPRDRLVGGREA